MEIWQNLEKKRNTDHDFPLPFMWVENNNLELKFDRLVSFSAHIYWGRKIIICLVFSKFCQISILLLHLVNTYFYILVTMAQLVRLTGRHEVVGSNPC